MQRAYLHTVAAVKGLFADCRDRRQMHLHQYSLHVRVGTCWSGAEPGGEA